MMRICVTQIRTARGDPKRNEETHIHWIARAITLKAELIVFPELSLSGYEPGLAGELAIEPDSPALEQFQQISVRNDIYISLGMPVRMEEDIHIGMVIFQPDGSRRWYTKQRLHPDEQPYFSEGKEQLILRAAGRKIAPAICFEALQPEHSENAHRMGAELYLVSAAKPLRGVKKAFHHLPQVAKKFSMPVVFSNSTGPCDSFISAGNSAVWDEHGNLTGQLDGGHEGALLYDTESGTVATL